MKKIILILFVIFFVGCNQHPDLYKITDGLVSSLQTEYESYGILGGTDYKQLTPDGKYQIMPVGRLINVKIMDVASDDDYEDLRQDLKNHYKGDSRVNCVYRCQAGTLMIDCRN